MPPKNPKDYIVVIEDFLASLPIIDHTNTRFKYKQIEYALYLNLNELHTGICFILTDGYSAYWLKQYEYHDFESFRHNLGIEGTYDGYFEILRNSIINKSILLDIDNHYLAKLTIKYQISKGVTLNGLFDLGNSIRWEKDPALFRKVNQNFLFDLQNYIELNNKRAEDDIKELKEKTKLLQGDDKKREIGGIGIEKNSTGLEKESLKQKAKTDLINPNRKKIKGKGAKFNVENVNLSINGE